MITRQLNIKVLATINKILMRKNTFCTKIKKRIRFFYVLGGFSTRNIRTFAVWFHRNLNSKYVCPSEGTTCGINEQSFFSRYKIYVMCRK